MVRDTSNNNNITTDVTYNNSSSIESSSCQASDSSNNENEGEFDWDKSKQGIVLSSFFYGYIVTQIPGGWLASRFGGKRVIGFSFLIVAIGTLLTPLAARWDYRAIAAVRVMMGLAQAVTYPGMHAMLGRWAPRMERTRFSSVIYAGAQCGNILAYMFSGLLCAYGFDNGWGSIFYIFGGLSVIWVACWFYVVADSPEVHPTISKAERDYIVNSIGDKADTKFHVPWGSILRSRAMWVCLIAHVCNNWMGYTLITGLPTFMKEVLKFDIKENGVLSAVPYAVMAVTSVVVGQLADCLRKRYLSTTYTRRLLQGISFLGSGVCIVAVGFVSCDQRALAVALLAIANGFDGMCNSGYIVNLLDIAPRYAGIMFGITNCMATIPGIVAPIAMGLLTPNKTPEEWRNVFYVCGGFSLAGAIAFGGFAQGELRAWAVDREKSVDISSGDHDNSDDDDEPQIEMDTLIL